MNANAEQLRAVQLRNALNAGYEAGTRARLINPNHTLVELTKKISAERAEQFDEEPYRSIWLRAFGAGWQLRPRPPSGMPLKAMSEPADQ